MNIDFSSMIKAKNSELNSIQKKTQTSQEKEELRKVCNDFESIFVNQLMKEMRKTVNKSGFIDGGNAEEIFQSMLDEQYAKEISKEGKLGLSDMLFRQLSRNM